MDRPNTLFEYEQILLQEFIESEQTKFSRIFYKKNAERLAHRFPNLSFEDLGDTKKCWPGQHLYFITKK